jgi:hypothetical protein
MHAQEAVRSVAGPPGSQPRRLPTGHASSGQAPGQRTVSEKLALSVVALPVAAVTRADPAIDANPCDVAGERPLLASTAVCAVAVAVIAVAAVTVAVMAVAVIG